MSCYISYLLRLQWVQDGPKPVRLMSLQSTKTGQVSRFADLNALFQFLAKELRENAEKESHNAPAKQEGEFLEPKSDGFTTCAPENAQKNATAS